MLSQANAATDERADTARDGTGHVEPQAETTNSGTLTWSLPGSNDGDRYRVTAVDRAAHPDLTGHESTVGVSQPGKTGSTLDAAVPGAATRPVDGATSTTQPDGTVEPGAGNTEQPGEATKPDASTAQPGETTEPSAGNTAQPSGTAQPNPGATTQPTSPSTQPGKTTAATEPTTPQPGKTTATTEPASTSTQPDKTTTTEPTTPQPGENTGHPSGTGQAVTLPILGGLLGSSTGETDAPSRGGLIGGLLGIVGGTLDSTLTSVDTVISNVPTGAVLPPVGDVLGPVFSDDTASGEVTAPAPTHAPANVAPVAGVPVKVSAPRVETVGTPHVVVEYLPIPDRPAPQPAKAPVEWTQAGGGSGGGGGLPTAPPAPVAPASTAGPGHDGSGGLRQPFAVAADGTTVTQLKLIGVSRDREVAGAGRDAALPTTSPD